MSRMVSDCIVKSPREVFVGFLIQYTWSNLAFNALASTIYERLRNSTLDNTES